jgi:predicted DNA-binding transcriptional regulator AlpA
MTKQKSRRPRRATEVTHDRLTRPNVQVNPLNPTPTPDANDFIPGPKLQAKLGISAVTLWRWRHDPDAGFPAAKLINGRLYFPFGAVAAWLARQPEAV